MAHEHRRRLLRRLLTSALALAVGLSSATTWARSDWDGLVEAESTAQARYWYRPGVDLGRYRGVLLRLPELSFTRELMARDDKLPADPRRVLTAAARAVAQPLRQPLNETLLGGNGQTLSTKRSPMVLLAQVFLADLQGHWLRSDGTVGMTLFAGSTSKVYLELYDALSGELLARVLLRDPELLPAITWYPGERPTPSTAIGEWARRLGRAAQPALTRMQPLTPEKP